MLPLPMVGRAEELAEIGQAWSDLPATVVLTGGPGSGKSALVRAALGKLDPAPATVLAGQARIHSPAPYDWLATVLSAHPHPDLPVPTDALAWLAQQPGPPPRRYAPGSLLRLAVRTVRALAGDGPAVIVVEDLHALDPASLNLVAELAAGALPALLLVTSRPPGTADVPELAARTLAQLAGAPGVIRQHLGPLDLSEVAALLERRYGSPAPPELVGVVHERTGGNPYRLTELLATSRSVTPAALLERIGAEPLPELTAREVEVLSCLAAGMSNQQVASALGISIRTVTVHVSNLLRKTRSSSRTEAAVWAVRHNLVALPAGDR
ncbi:MAG TPA: LuxR C-terminal-related transcriptional regulator [Natronosporangium sp.]